MNDFTTLLVSYFYLDILPLHHINHICDQSVLAKIPSQCESRYGISSQKESGRGVNKERGEAVAQQLQNASKVGHMTLMNCWAARLSLGLIYHIMAAFVSREIIHCSWNQLLLPAPKFLLELWLKTRICVWLLKLWGKACRKLLICNIHYLNHSFKFALFEGLNTFLMQPEMQNVSYISESLFKSLCEWTWLTFLTFKTFALTVRTVLKVLWNGFWKGQLPPVFDQDRQHV